MDKLEFQETLQAVLQIPLHEYLAQIGLQPDKQAGSQYLYKSPFRAGKKGGIEKTASLSVNIDTYKFYDHGDARYNGNIIDFVAFLNNWNAQKDMLKIFDEIKKTMGGRVQQILKSPEIEKAIYKTANVKTESKIRIAEVKELFSYPLLDYIKSRKISEKTARKYLKEVHYFAYDRQTKPYYALGFKNNSGGYELRNKNFQGCSVKGITTIVFNENIKRVAIFEGFFDFLSFLEHQPAHDIDAIIVLNSAGIWESALENISTWLPEEVSLYLDNDKTGSEKTALFIERLGEMAKDQRSIFKNFKDYNDFLCSL